MVVGFAHLQDHDENLVWRRKETRLQAHETKEKKKLKEEGEACGRPSDGRGESFLNYEVERWEKKPLEGRGARDHDHCGFLQAVNRYQFL